MRKILLISHGNSIHTIKWVSALQKKYKIFLFDWRPINEDNYDDLDNVVLLQSKKNGANENPFLSYCKAFFKIKKISKKLLPDLIHAHYASSYGLLGIKAKNTLLITSVWGTDITDFPYKSIFHKKIIKYVLKKSDYIFVTSNSLISKQSNNNISKFICCSNYIYMPFMQNICRKPHINKFIFFHIPIYLFILFFHFV